MRLVLVICRGVEEAGQGGGLSIADVWPKMLTIDLLSSVVDERLGQLDRCRIVRSGEQINDLFHLEVLKLFTLSFP